MADTNEIPAIFDGYVCDEDGRTMRKGTTADKIIHYCLTAHNDESSRFWQHAIDASIPLDEVEIQPASHVFITGEASMEKYCALCCKVVAGGAREITLVKGESLADLDANVSKGCAIVWPLDQVELTYTVL